METNKHTTLGDEDFLEFLAETAETELPPDGEPSDGNSVSEADLDMEDIDDESLLDKPISEDMDDREIEASFGEFAWGQLNGDVFVRDRQTVRLAAKRSAETRRRKEEEAKRTRIEIQRAAFNQKLIRLDDAIPKSELQILISLLVSEHTRMMDKYSNLINRRLTVLLSPAIPKRLKRCYILFPESIKMTPGFLYTAGPEYGQNKTFWATPELPNFFAPGDEQKIMDSKELQFRVTIDKAVALYHQHREQCIKKEVSYASILLRKKVRTYYDLLKANPMWFNELFKYLKQKQNHE